MGKKKTEENKEPGQGVQGNTGTGEPGPGKVQDEGSGTGAGAGNTGSDSSAGTQDTGQDTTGDTAGAEFGKPAKVKFPAHYTGFRKDKTFDPLKGFVDLKKKEIKQNGK